jgi:hypothetical protein
LYGQRDTGKTIARKSSFAIVSRFLTGCPPKLAADRYVEILTVMPYVYGALGFIGVVAVVFVSLVALGRVLG